MAPGIEGSPLDIRSHRRDQNGEKLEEESTRSTGDKTDYRTQPVSSFARVFFVSYTVLYPLFNLYNTSAAQRD